MTQRLDDVTGDPIRLSAQQRELQRAGMIAMLNAQTRQINTLTANHRVLQERIAELLQSMSTLQDQSDQFQIHLGHPWRHLLRALVRRWF